MVGRWARDRKVAGSTPGRCIDGQQLWASCSHPCASSSIIWYRPRGGDNLRWESNRRSGVALAMRHRLSGLSTYGLTALGREMSTPPTPQ